jgi:hypothetical protein
MGLVIEAEERTWERAKELIAKAQQNIGDRSFNGTILQHPPQM